MTRILGLSGSLRKASYNRALIRAAIDIAPPEMEIQQYYLDDLPLFSQDLEEGGDPEPVQTFKSKIRAADGLLIATPEYQYSVTGVLKNAIDWASRPPSDAPLDGKPVAMMGASPGRVGTARSHMHLRQILSYNEMDIVLRPEVLVARAADKFDDDGNLADEMARKLIRQLLGKLASRIN